jgi:UDP-N-acetylmuramoyl-L-alanyl-D-glutamate--2,6-diaminopimelate ligase
MNSDYLIIKERYAMKLADMLVKTEYEIIYGDTEKKISGIEFDSRNCVPGSMFVAVSGFETDGNRFIDKAIENGAVAILSDKNPEKQYPNLSYIKVNDARRSMSEVASVYYREPSKEIKVIGITGTNGKTSTAYFLKNILEHCGKKTGIIGTLGNYFNDMRLETTHTTPESVEVQRLLRDMADKGAEFVVMEVSSHGLELFRVEDVKFSGGVFTNLTQDHLDFHKTMEEYYL